MNTAFVFSRLSNESQKPDMPNCFTVGHINTFDRPDRPSDTWQYHDAVSSNDKLDTKQMSSTGRIYTGLNPRGLVDGLTRFFTPSDKRNSRVSRNDLVGAPSSPDLMSSRKRRSRSTTGLAPCKDQTRLTTSLRQRKIVSAAKMLIHKTTSRQNSQPAVRQAYCRLKPNNTLGFCHEGQCEPQAVDHVKPKVSTCDPAETNLAFRSHEPSELSVADHFKQSKPSALSQNNPSRTFNEHDPSEPSALNQRFCSSVLALSKFKPSQMPALSQQDLSVMSAISPREPSKTTISNQRESGNRRREQLTDALSHFFTATGKRRACVPSRLCVAPWHPLPQAPPQSLSRPPPRDTIRTLEGASAERYKRNMARSSSTSSDIWRTTCEKRSSNQIKSLVEEKIAMIKLTRVAVDHSIQLLDEFTSITVDRSSQPLEEYVLSKSVMNVDDDIFPTGTSSAQKENCKKSFFSFIAMIVVEVNVHN